MAPRSPKGSLQLVISGLHEVAPVFRNSISKESRSSKSGFEIKSPRQRRPGLDKKRDREDGKRVGQQAPETQGVLPASPSSFRRRSRLTEPHRLHQGQLDFLPPPETLDAAALGRAAAVAARDPGGGTPAVWAAVVNRARELLPTLDPEDLARLLSGMARVRYDEDQALIGELGARVRNRLAYFNTLHLAVVLNALSKIGISTEDREALLGELSDRVPELQSASELAMSVGALGRLRSCDRQLIGRIANQVDLRLSAGGFGIRELSTVSAAYVQLQHFEAVHFEHVAMCAAQTMHLATPLEIARIVYAAALSSGAVQQPVALSSTPDWGASALLASESTSARTKLLTTALPLAEEKVPFMLPTELVETAAAFHSAAEARLCDVHEVVPVLVMVLREVLRTRPERLTAQQLSMVLRGCARCSVPLASEDLLLLPENVAEVMSPTEACDTLIWLAKLRSFESAAPATSHVSTAASGVQAVSTTASATRMGADVDKIASAAACPPGSLTELGQLVLRALAEGDNAFAEADVVAQVVEALFVLAPDIDRAGAGNGMMPIPVVEPRSALSEALAARLSRAPPIGMVEAEGLRSRLLQLGAHVEDSTVQVLLRHIRSIRIQHDDVARDARETTRV